jgi:pSer/pThr/pTyr-binding forkhead associated (FHA) protein
MTGFVLTLLRLIFLALLFIFVWQVSRSMSRHVGSITPSQKRTKNEIVFVRSESQAGESYVIKDALTFGRSPDADVLLDDPYASEFHLRLVSEDDRLTLHDLGSTNGTYLNGRRVTNPVVLSKSDSLQVGKTVMEVR